MDFYSKLFKCAFLWLFVIQLAASARILGIFNVPSISHQVVFRGLMLELAKKGHEVVVVTTDPVENPPANYTQIDVHDVSYPIFQYAVELSKGKPTQDHQPEQIALLFGAIFEAQLTHPEVQAVINVDNKFDLIILEAVMLVNYAFMCKLKAPYIGITSLPTFSASYANIGAPVHPILYPDMMKEKLYYNTLWERLEAAYSFVNDHLSYLKGVKITDAIMRKHLGDDCPSLREIENNVDLMITNSYPILTGIRPTVPAIINAGGLHIKKKAPIPKELDEYLNKSKNGVVYVSFGTNVLAKDLPPPILNMLLAAFSELPYDFIWKFELDDLPNKPSNVRISKWLPQNDLLGHPKTKAFVTQGGLQSMEEAINNAVPLVGIPFIGDQFLNVQKMAKKNAGIALDAKTLTKEILVDAIKSVINNPIYKSNVTKLRELVYDEPETGMERAVWWVEYVIRHKGAKHLRSPAADASLAEYLMLDVVAVVVAALVLALAVVIMVLSFVFRLFKRASVNKEVKNKNMKKKRS